MLMKARIERRTLPDTGRIVAISDVHGNLEYLRGLLNKLDLRGEDTLVFCGDIMEKGPQSLDTLHFLMDLNERRRCWFVLGNCDYWYDERDHSKPCRDWYVRDYLLTNANGNGPGLLQQMCDAAGVTVDEDFDIDAYYKALGAGYRDAFISLTAKRIAAEGIAKLEGLERDELKAALLTYRGIGPKVADCICLFGFGRRDAFPVDTWIEKLYHEDFKGTLTDRKKINAYFTSLFGQFSGYVQQYLFYAKRANL